MSKLALRFISGKYKGGEFPLKDGKEIVIGRSSDLDIVLLEDMVSRRHTVLTVDGDQIHITDNGSTNGTFVNGEKISSATLVKGDRILIGTSIMKVVDASDQTHAVSLQNPTVNYPAQDHARQTHGMAKNTMHSGARSMSGTISEVPLPDLIQLFSTSKKTGTLVLNNAGVIAKIHLDKGRIVYASLSDQPNLDPLKAMFRILAWNDGDFDLIGPEPHNFPNLINMPTEHILMEGLRQLDELRHAEDKLPPKESVVKVIIPLQPQLSFLEPRELDIFQIALANITIGEIIDISNLSDKETSDIIIKLIKEKYLEVEDFI
jgi:hypothetical protein